MWHLHLKDLHIRTLLLSLHHFPHQPYRTLLFSPLQEGDRPITFILGPTARTLFSVSFYFYFLLLLLFLFSFPIHLWILTRPLNIRSVMLSRCEVVLATLSLHTFSDPLAGLHCAGLLQGTQSLSEKLGRGMMWCMVDCGQILDIHHALRWHLRCRCISEQDKEVCLGHQCTVCRDCWERTCNKMYKP